MFWRQRLTDRKSGASNPVIRERPPASAFDSTVAHVPSHQELESLYEARTRRFGGTSSPENARRYLEAHLVATERESKELHNITKTLSDQGNGLRINLEELEREKDELVKRSRSRPVSFTIQLQKERQIFTRLVEISRQLKETSRLEWVLFHQYPKLKDYLRELEKYYAEGKLGGELRNKIALLDTDCRLNSKEVARISAQVKLEDGVENSFRAQEQKPKFSSDTSIVFSEHASAETQTSRPPSVNSALAWEDVEFLHTQLKCWEKFGLDQRKVLEERSLERSNLKDEAQKNKNEISKLKLEARALKWRLRELLTDANERDKDKEYDAF